MREIMGLEEDKTFTLACPETHFASRLAQRGVDFHKISVLMGHKTLAMTKRYSHLKPKHTFSVVNVLDSDRENNDSHTVTKLPIDKRPIKDSIMLDVISWQREKKKNVGNSGAPTRT